MKDLKTCYESVLAMHL